SACTPGRAAPFSSPPMRRIRYGLLPSAVACHRGKTAKNKGPTMSDIVLDTKPILERFRLNGRTALVTGAGGGIGRGYAHALGEAGASVAVVDIALTQAEEVAHELTAKGVDAIALKADVTK